MQNDAIYSTYCLQRFQVHHGKLTPASAPASVQPKFRQNPSVHWIPEGQPASPARHPTRIFSSSRFKILTANNRGKHVLKTMCVYMHGCIYAHYITLHYITLHYVTLRYVALHLLTLHHVTLRYVTLHYMHTYSVCMSQYNDVQCIHINYNIYIYISPKWLPGRICRQKWNGCHAWCPARG